VHVVSIRRDGTWGIWWRNNHDSVDVVGHDDKRVHLDFAADGWRSIPSLGYDTTPCVQVHPASYDLAEEAHAIVRADGDKIRGRAAVIPSGQADGSTMVPIGIVRHGGIQAVISSTRHVLNAARNACPPEAQRRPVSPRADCNFDAPVANVVSTMHII
jgi:hypothetical protein